MTGPVAPVGAGASQTAALIEAMLRYGTSQELRDVQRREAPVQTEDEALMPSDQSFVDADAATMDPNEGAPGAGRAFGAGGGGGPRAAWSEGQNQAQTGGLSGRPTPEQDSLAQQGEASLARFAAEQNGRQELQRDDSGREVRVTREMISRLDGSRGVGSGAGAGGSTRAGAGAGNSGMGNSGMGSAGTTGSSGAGASQGAGLNGTGAAMSGEAGAADGTAGDSDGAAGGGADAAPVAGSGARNVWGGDVVAAVVGSGMGTGLQTVRRAGTGAADALDDDGPDTVDSSEEATDTQHPHATHKSAGRPALGSSLGFDGQPDQEQRGQFTSGGKQFGGQGRGTGGDGSESAGEDPRMGSGPVDGRVVGVTGGGFAAVTGADGVRSRADVAAGADVGAGADVAAGADGGARADGVTGAGGAARADGAAAAAEAAGSTTVAAGTLASSPFGATSADSVTTGSTASFSLGIDFMAGGDYLFFDDARYLPTDAA